MREIMDTLGPSHPCQESGLEKGTQIAGTEAILNAIAYWMKLAPSPILNVMPTTDMAKLHSKQRVDPMIDSCAVLKPLVKPSRARDSGNTVLVKKYRGGLYRMAGANSGPGLRSMPAVRFLSMDEIDAFPGDVGGEGDPCAVATKRTDTLGRRKKIFRTSTPKLEETSRIDKYYRGGTQARYYVPCPHCQHEQWLRWEQMRCELAKVEEHVCLECGGVTPIGESGAMACAHCGAALQAERIRISESDDVLRAWYECEHCEGDIEERWKPQIFSRGRHIHHVAPRGRALPAETYHPYAIWVRRGEEVVRWLPNYEEGHRPLTWHLSGLYSPLGWFSWRSAWVTYRTAQRGGFDEETGEPLMQVFENTVLGKPFRATGEELKQSVLQMRAESYAQGTVPAGGLFLTCWVDVQGNRLEYLVKAWGRGEENWPIDYGQIYGDPNESGPDSVWARLEAFVPGARRYPHAGGQSLAITATGVDCNYLTDRVHDFVRKWGRKQVISTRGEPGNGRPIIGRPRKIDYTHHGKHVRRGAEYHPIGTDTAKERLFEDLKLDKPGPGYVHFARWLPDEFYEQLTAERMIPRKRRGRNEKTWIQIRARNEALDMEVGNRAVAIYAGLKRVPWDALERAINPPVQDLFAQPTSRAVSGEAGAVGMTPPAEPDPPDVPRETIPAQARPVRAFSRPGNWVTGFRP